MFDNTNSVRVRVFSIWLILLSGLITMSVHEIQAQENDSQRMQDALQIYRQYKPVVGQPHPDFILPSIDGEKIQLSKYRGKKVLLLHFASW